MKESLLTTKARDWAYENSPYTSNQMFNGLGIPHSKAKFLCGKFLSDGNSDVCGFGPKDKVSPGSEPFLYRYMNEPETYGLENLDYVFHKDIPKQIDNPVAVIRDGKPLMVCVPVDQWLSMVGCKD